MNKKYERLSKKIGKLKVHTIELGKNLEPDSFYKRD